MLDRLNNDLPLVVGIFDRYSKSYVVLVGLDLILIQEVFTRGIFRISVLELNKVCEE